MTDPCLQPYRSLPARGDQGGISCAVVLALCLSGTVAGAAQTPAAAPQGGLVPPPAWAANDYICAPSLAMARPTSNLRVVGSLDVAPKALLGPGDTLVISGGAAGGLQPGQEYFVRRLANRFGAKDPDREHPMGVHTVARVRILAVETAVGTATVLHACDGILLDDYLEPFTPPLVAARAVPGGADQMGHILEGDEARSHAGINRFIMIDRGSDHGVAVGQRLLVFRDQGGEQRETDGRSAAFRQSAAGLPLVQIGEVVVVSVQPETSTVQVVTARDSVRAGDLVAGAR